VNDHPECLLAELTPRLWRFALRLTREPHAAESLVTSACRQALQEGDPAPRPPDLAGRLYSIVHALWWNELRPYQRPARSGAVTAAALGDQLHGLAWQRVIAQVDSLTDELRSAMLLVAVEGFTPEQAAVILGIPLDVLRCRLAQARLHIGTTRIDAGDDPHAAAAAPAAPDLA